MKGTKKGGGVKEGRKKDIEGNQKEKRTSTGRNEGKEGRNQKEGKEHSQTDAEGGDQGRNTKTLAVTFN